MDALTREFVTACEVHSVARLRAVLEAGFDVRAPIDGASPVTTLVEMYYRSEAFAACLAMLLDAGGVLEDPVLAPVLALLLAHGARTDFRVAGVTWGRGFPWATLCFAVTPISYAQCGGLPQFQRDAIAVATNVRAMFAAAGRAIPADWNVPNAYLCEGEA
ncbi:MAG: hypothetical protein IPK72_24775 [Candidatus Eisenbacteria bacterium]|nr:hypothetical protein [Candidatus Eisenbacteria bacterium]